MKDVVDQRVTTVVIGKIHISDWAKVDFESKLREFLSTKQKYNQFTGIGKGKFFWTFTNFSEQKLDDDTVFFARLVKIKKQIRETVFDEKNWMPTRTERDSPSASYSNFIIIPYRHVIIFEELSSISIKTFMDMFSSMCRQLFFGAKIRIILTVERQQILIKLKNYDKVTKVHLLVTPSNPDTGDWRRLDLELKEGGVEEATLEYRSKGGLKIENSIIGEAIALASAGYGGPQKITVEKQGKEEVINSEDELIRLRVPYSENPDTLTLILYQRYIDSLHGKDEQHGL